MTAAQELKEKMAAFKAAVYGLPCAGCGKGPFGTIIRSHHVVYRQALGVKDEWRPENAMPLCDPCHTNHHAAAKRIPLTALSEENLEFAREVLGEAADYYLERRYAA